MTETATTVPKPSFSLGSNDFNSYLEFAFSLFYSVKMAGKLQPMASYNTEAAQKKEPNYSHLSSS